MTKPHSEMSKACFKCGSILPLSEFYAHPEMGDGHLGKCKDCTKKDARENREKNIAYYLKYDKERYQTEHRKLAARKACKAYKLRSPEKYSAHYLLGNAIRRGEVKRGACEVCGEAKVQGHHDDYSKPLEVRWLCFKHHRMVHGQRNFCEA